MNYSPETMELEGKVEIPDYEFNKTDSECDCGHVCTSGCQKDFDCPCLENCSDD